MDSDRNAADFDPWEMLPETNIVLRNDFDTLLSSRQWKERKEALEVIKKFLFFEYSLSRNVAYHAFSLFFSLIWWLFSSFYFLVHFCYFLCYILFFMLYRVFWKYWIKILD